jgi:hypothetical protein
MTYDRDIGRVPVRLPASLKAILAQKARANRRSLNAEILMLLEASVASESQGQERAA